MTHIIQSKTLLTIKRFHFWLAKTLIKIILGSLIPVHQQPVFNAENIWKVCGSIRDQYGIQRVEALLYMLDKINDKSRTTNLLQGIHLGIEIRDECWETSIALEETIHFIKDTISSDDAYGLTGHNEPGSNESMNEIETLKKQNRVIAVIGPGGSSVTINVQNLLQLFDIPHIGYSATSKDLSDKKLFKTFLRVVPSDYLQVKAMVDIVIKMNWTYLLAVYTDGSYGQGGMDAFRTETGSLNICLALYEKISEYASDSDYELVIKKMNETGKAKVIVCFCYGETIRGLLKAIKTLKLSGRFIILGR